MVLASDGFKEESAFEGVGDEDSEEDGEGEEPDDEVHERVDIEELGGGRGGKVAPKDGLACETETNTEAVDGEAEEEGPQLICWEENFFLFLPNEL